MTPGVSTTAVEEAAAAGDGEGLGIGVLGRLLPVGALDCRTETLRPPWLHPPNAIEKTAIQTALRRTWGIWLGSAAFRLKTL